MDIKQNILYRTYIVLFLIIGVAFIILSRVFQIQVFEGKKWRAMGDSLYVKLMPVDAPRGNIYAHDGSLLATSLPYYEVRWDATVVPQDTFDYYVDQLSTMIGTYINTEFTAGAIRQKLTEARNTGNRYYLVGNNLSYPDLQRLRTFPIFNKGQYKGGLIVMQENKRQRPFKLLALRTIGRYDVVENKLPNGNIDYDTFAIGLEGAFNEYLAGEDGKQVMQNMGGNLWVPVNDASEIEPRAGMDVMTTIDVNIQDVAESALLNALQTYQAKAGCAVVMDVKTGAIRAMANLGRSETGEYWEDYNYAVAMNTEPGSTFKLATMLALLEDGYINLGDSIDLQQGKAKFYDEDMEDSSPHGIGMATVQKAFEISSNVGMAKLVDKYYNRNGRESRFTDYMRSFKLDQATGIELGGEPLPYIKDKKRDADSWSGITLPWMATGYELKITPLQLLMFYNAVANGGKMMKPYLVEEVRHYGKSVKTYSPQVVDRKIASSSSLATATQLLEGVVERGTAENIKTDKYRIAGKTGTAIMNYGAYHSNQAGKKYQASFAGFFPAEKPLYSCVVVIYDPQYGLYGGTVAAPVFRAIADRCYALSYDQMDPLSKPKEKLTGKQLPNFQVAFKSDLEEIFDELNLRYYDESEESEIAVVRSESDSVKLLPRNFRESQVPNVVGMGLRDATFLLENLGIRVRPVGVGKVKSQSIKPGQNAKSVRSITLVLG